MLANRIRVSGAGREIGYVLATDDDFSGDKDGNFIYIGTDKYVEIPHVIKGVNVTNYPIMFRDTSVRGVTSTNKNIWAMSSMFQDSKATILDLSNLDTSNVEYMNQMFYGSQATSLDISSFDTSKVANMISMFRDTYATSLDLSNFNTSSVTSMGWMFQDSHATSLDLSSFDTSNVTSMTSMFQNTQATSLDLSSFDTSNVTSMTSMFFMSKATIGYARTQADADRFNSSSNKPARLTFIVKD